MKTVNSPYKVVKEKKTGALIFLMITAFAILFSLSYVSSLEARILGGKMVLRGETGETIEKSIKVINNNSYAVKIELVPDGDLKNSITIEDSNFTLETGDEKDAFFKIKITKEGRSDSTINVKFIAADLQNGKNGVIIPASIIVFAQKGNYTDNNPDDTADNGVDNDGNNDGNTNGDGNNSLDINPLAIGLVITAVVFVVFLVSLFMYSKNKNKFKNIDKKEEEIKIKKRAEK